MRKLASEKIGSEEGLGEVALSERGPRRGKRAEVNLPLGYGSSDKSSEEWKTGLKEEGSTRSAGRNHVFI